MLYAVIALVIIITSMIIDYKLTDIIINSNLKPSTIKRIKCANDYLPMILCPLLAGLAILNA